MSKLQTAYNNLIDVINELAKDAGGLKVTDFAPIRTMTEAVKEVTEELTTTKQEATAYRISLENLEAENEKLKKAWEAAAAMGTDHELKHRELLTSLPKIKADAVLKAAKDLDLHKVYYADTGTSIGDEIAKYTNNLNPQKIESTPENWENRVLGADESYVEVSDTDKLEVRE